MRILIVGYGSMGHEVEKALEARGHTVTGRVDPSGSGDATGLTGQLLDGSDGVIEFSLAAGIIENITAYAEAKVPAVIGTTGWEASRRKAEEIVRAAGSSLLWGNNFSVGANIFFALTARAAALINSLDEYDVMLNECHHKRKKDSPSGTALTAAELVLANLDRKRVIQTEALHRAIREDELHVGSIRGGSIPGIHRLSLDSEADTIEISHTARSRAGFALGSVGPLSGWMEKPGFSRLKISLESFFKESEV